MSVRDDLHHNKDLVIALVGVAVLAVLTVGMFALGQVQLGPGDSGQLGIYRITFSEEDHSLELGDRAEGTLSDGESKTTMVPIEVRNVTSAEFRLTWSSSGPGDLNPDEFGLQVEPPGPFACEGKVTGTDGTLTITCEGVPVPGTIESMAGEGSDGALRNAARSQAPPDDRATGVYNVTVTLEDTGPEPTDEGNDYELSASYSDFHAHAEKTRSA